MNRDMAPLHRTVDRGSPDAAAVENSPPPKLSEEEDPNGSSNGTLTDLHPLAFEETSVDVAPLVGRTTSKRGPPPQYMVEDASDGSDSDSKDDDGDDDGENDSRGELPLSCELLEEWYHGKDGDNIYSCAIEASPESDGEDDEGDGVPADQRRALLLASRPSVRRIVERRMSSQHKAAAAAVGDRKLFKDLQGKMRDTGVKTEAGLAQLLSDPEKLKAVEDMVEQHKKREEAVKAFDESLEADLRSVAASAGLELEADFGGRGGGLLGTITRGVGRIGASITHRKIASDSEWSSGHDPGLVPISEAPSEGRDDENAPPHKFLTADDGQGPWWKRRRNYRVDAPLKSEGVKLPKESIAALLTGDRPYVRLPSRADREVVLLEALCAAASGHGGPLLVSICGAPYVGKSRMLREVVVESDHIEMAGFAVLKSYRTELDGGTSYFPLRQVVMSALQMSDAKNESSNGELTSSGHGLDDDDVIEIFASEEGGACTAVERLISARILTASDRLALGLVLPELGQTGQASCLLATLQGQSPAALAKSVADSLLKVLAPLQPLAMIWEGDGELDPCTKSVLSEMMNLAKERCPRMLVAIESRRPVTLPYSLLDEAKEVRLTALEKEETEIHLRSALSLDRISEDGEEGTTDISEKLLDTIHDRSAGCPLFIDRLAAWAVERDMIRCDPERDLVVFKSLPSSRNHNAAMSSSHPSHPRETVANVELLDLKEDEAEAQVYDADADALPMDLSDMVLEKFNDLPPHLWETLKVASCIGPTFNADDYQCLRSSCQSGISAGNDEDGFMDNVRKLEANHGVFEHRDSLGGGGSGHGGLYRWKRREVYEAVSSVVISNERREIHSAIVDRFESCDNPVSGLNGNNSDKDEGDVNQLPGQVGVQKRRKRSSVIVARHSSLAKRWDIAFGHYVDAGVTAEAMMKFTEAERMYRKAIECWEKAASENVDKLKGTVETKESEEGPSVNNVGDDEYIRANIKLGNCLRELAQFTESEKILTTCLEVASDVRKEEGNAPESGGEGTLNPTDNGNEETYLHALASLARLHQNQSKYDKAKELYEQALPIARSKKESQPGPWLAGHISGYAEILRKAGELKQAEELHLEALELRQSSAVKGDGKVEDGNSTELELAVSYTQLGCTVSGLGRPKETQEYHNRALAARLGHLGLTHALVSESLNYCAEALHKLGRSREGVALGVHAVRIRRKAFGRGHPAYAHALSVLASCYHGVGRSCDAQVLLEECIGVCEKAFSADHANMIPNLMAYGDVLRALNKNVKAKGIFERAASIHRKNFKNGQRTNQLEKCETNIAELTKILSTSTEIEEEISYRDDETVVTAFSPRTQFLGQTGGVCVPIPAVDASVSGTGSPIIVLTDIGEHPQDEYLLVLLASLRQVNLLNPLAVVASLRPQRMRASLTRGILDALGLPDIPVGTGSSCRCADKDGSNKPSVYNTEYSRPCSCTSESGVDLMARALESSQDGSVQLLCATSLTDVSTLIKDHEELFVKKVKEITVMGSLKPLGTSRRIFPDEGFGRKRDMQAAEHVYNKCQELRIPTLTVAEAISNGCPFSSAMVEDLSKTEHMVSTGIRANCEASMNSLWKKANALAPVERSEPVEKRHEKGINALWKNLSFNERKEKEDQPARRDRKWFCKHYFGAEDVPYDVRTSIWGSVSRMEMCAPLALLTCVDTYRDTRFQWETKQVKGTPHRITGASKTESGIVCSDALPLELSTLLQLAFQSSIENMC